MQFFFSGDSGSESNKYDWNNNMLNWKKGSNDFESMVVKVVNFPG